jgi:lysophospholipase L1-like esterase
MRAGDATSPAWLRGVAKLCGLAVVTAVLVAAALTRPYEPPPAEARALPSPSATAADEGTVVVRLAAVGDSITASGGALRDGEFNENTWLSHVVDSSAVRWAGGWAEPGATTAAMAEGVQPVGDADVLVIMAGTNDSGQGVPFGTTGANLERIVDVVGAERVVVASIPPREPDPHIAIGFNALLEPFVVKHGWDFVDAAGNLREENGGWLPELTEDGIHPTAEGQAIIGAAIKDAVLSG